MLDGQETVLESRLVRQGIQGAELVQLLLPAKSRHFIAQGGEGRIAAPNPAPRGHAVGDINKLTWPEGIETREEMRPQQTGVQFRHAIYVVRTYHGQVGHPHALNGTFLDDGKLGLLFVVARPAVVDLTKVTAVDFVDDFEVTREDLLEERHGPSLERLG